MQVNFVHNYSKTFFKGSSISFKAKAVPNEPLTAEKFGDFARQQAWHNQAVLETLKAILELLQPPATPSIDINDPTIKKPILNYIGKIKKPILNQGDIVKTNKTTYTMRDGSIVTVDEGSSKTITFDYSNCPNRDKNDPIKEIIRNPDTPEETFERRWENDTYDRYNVNGDLIETKIMKSNYCITFERDVFVGYFYVTHEEGKNTQYPPEYFAINPDDVEYDENDNLETIYPDYGKGYDYRNTKIDSLDRAIDKIQHCSCPLNAIGFYPSGQIKSEYYRFNLNGWNRTFEIKFNENGQVDNIIILDEHNEVIEKKTSSRYKEDLNNASYKGYTEYASNFKERAEIAYSLRKRSEETPQ